MHKPCRYPSRFAQKEKEMKDTSQDSGKVIMYSVIVAIIIFFIIKHFV